MKLNKKFLTISLAAVIAISPATLMAGQNTPIVTAAKISQGRKLKLNRNAYIYNRRGRRIRYGRRYKLHQGQSVRFVKKVKPMTSAKRYYFKDDQGNGYYLPYVKIRGGYYYQIGKHAYINCANVDSISGHLLYVSQATVTLREGHNYHTGRPNLINVRKPTNHESFYNPDADTTKNLKVGQKITIDAVYYNQEMSNQDFTFYRIKGTSGSKTQVISEDYINNLPRQLLETDRASSGLTTNKPTPVYNAAGQVISKNDLHKNYSFGSFEKVWLWVPSAHKAELFYQMSNNLWSTKNDDAQGDYTDGIVPYLPASAVNYQEGPTFKAVNTAADAEADAKVATAADKQELHNLIAERDTVTSSTAFRLDPNTAYLGSLLLAQRVLNDKTATVNQVKATVRYLQRLKNSMQGVKIPVKDINRLSRKEAVDIVEAAEEYYNALHAYDQHNNSNYRVQFNSNRTQLTLTIQQYQDRKNHEPQYLQKTTRQTLNISNYAEQR